MTEQEKQEIVSAVLEQMKAGSNDVADLTELTTLENVTSLPAQRGAELVSVPVPLLAKPAVDAAAAANTAAGRAETAAAGANDAKTAANTAAADASKAAEKANDAAQRAEEAIKDDYKHVPITEADFEKLETKDERTIYLVYEDDGEGTV